MADGCGRRLLVKSNCLPILFPATEPPDLRLPTSGDLLLEYVCNDALALDCEDQCEGGCYLHHQPFYDGVVIAGLEEAGTQQNTTQTRSLRISSYVENRFLGYIF